MSTHTRTIVIFRKWRHSAGGDITALMPTVPVTLDGTLCMSYEHVGQHSGADYSFVILATTPATPYEYRALAAELRKLGYNLDIRNRTTPAMHAARRREAARQAKAPYTLPPQEGGTQ